MNVRNIIQFALKDYQEGDSAVKKTLSDLALPLLLLTPRDPSCEVSVTEE
jgi:hypothetical protein